MPIFEFECRKCGHRFEELLLRSDEKVRCPKCSSGRVSRLYSGFAVHGGSRSSGSSCATCSAKSCHNCK